MADELTADERLAIFDLMARYAWSIDTCDVEGYVDCFTSDAIVSMRGNANVGH
ncbi:MAG: nuclear transport factor 2 family protein, partial [Dehalococcoidia bacterium]